MSTQRRIYLDWNATAPPCDAARAAIAEVLAETGNPSSVHAEGRRARDRLERARAAVAALVGRPREQVIFTSGGTEANWLGVAALAREVEARGKPLVAATTRFEHPSLAGAVHALAARGWTVHDELTPDASLVAIGLVNHELGTLAEAVADGPLVHVDAVQAVGKVALPRCDSLAISAHKLGGPMGVGALVTAIDSPGSAGARSDAERRGVSIDPGVPAAGHQERGRRPGTENVLGIVGFGAAAAAVDPAEWPRVVELGDRLERGLLAIEGVRIHGADRPRAGGTINAGFTGARGQDLVIALDLAGIAASTGAACTSGTVRPSPVLLALGLPPERAVEAVRFSLGRTTTAAEIEEVLRVLPAIVQRARLHR
ncbi:MAG TPA: aminotransferase class V-fold PLP-dependent enzyme [Kofleriaceae bacterium]|nr:aminotransferase class V-fold PLP-dependent enzyme [Kofleriaceae bacterium]